MSNLDYIKRFECSICTEEFSVTDTNKQPHVLSCGHSFCFACLSAMVKNNRIVCKACNGVTKIIDTVASLKKDESLIIMLGSLVENSTVDNAAKMLECSECDTLTATVCLMCAGNPVLCGDCFSAIHVTPKRKTHQLSSCTERQAVICKEHQKECELYCFDDYTLVCVTCANNGNHEDHSIGVITKAGTTLRPKIISKYKSILKDITIDARSLIRLRQEEILLQAKIIQSQRESAYLKKCIDQEDEFKFIVTLEEKPAPQPFKGSKLLSQSEKDCLSNWEPGDWKLIYRASTHGFLPSVFHQKCDNKGPTFVVISSGANRFGGYASSSWNSSTGYDCKISAPESFLFSLVNPFGDGYTKFPVKSGINNALCGNCSCGPIFGETSFSCDLGITTGLISNIGRCYSDTLNRKNSTFTVESGTLWDYEVFAKNEHIFL